ncbi:MFS transporter [Rhodococcus sp. D2-41]|uniref:MFS transporter n=1 Tax=Speluncibacter jeojiensis TaxID=2710754 RepID=A0A9X4LZY1_9ACTN|nr:MFS transporter [Rhodococcus sp. D2-41]MDG3008952.1 MFS transporter [Rhodococcus sp. D2-41]MDG3015463.1 MFS transporter [Corynebacteriales bacterium D3-21]
MAEHLPPPLSRKPADAESRSKARSILIIAVVALMTEIVAFEFTLVAPGLPEMAAAFRTQQIALVMTTPLLVAGVTVPIVGKIADVYGKKKVLLATGAAFLLGTVLCAIASAFPLFLVGRGLQGLGLVSPVICYGLVRDLIPAKWVPLGIGGIGVGIGASSLIGPLLGGWMIDHHGYRGALWVLFVYSVVIVAAIAICVPETTVRIAHRIDYFGAALLGIGATALIAGGIRPDLRALAFPLGIVLLVAFVLVERRIAQPLISMSLLARPGVWMTLLLGAAYGVYNGANAALLPQYLRLPAIPGDPDSGLGMTATQYSLYYGLSSGVVAAACGILGGWAARRFAPRTVGLVAMVAAVIAGLLIGLDLIGSFGMVIVYGVAFGVGNGLYYVSTTNLLIEAVPANTQAVSSSMKFTAEQVVGALSSAYLGVLIGSYVLMVNPKTGQPIPSAQGFRYAYLICAVAAAIGVVVLLLMRHGRTPATGGVVSGQGDEDPRPETAAVC